MDSLEPETKRQKLSSSELEVSGTTSPNNKPNSETKPGAVGDTNQVNIVEEMTEADQEVTKATASPGPSSAADSGNLNVVDAASNTDTSENQESITKEVIDVDALTDTTVVPTAANNVAAIEGETSGIKSGLVISKGASMAIIGLLKGLDADKTQAITKVDLENISSAEGKTFHQIYFCVAIEKTSEEYLKSLQAFVASNPKVLQNTAKVSVILDYFGCNGWTKTHQPVKTAHNALLDAFQKTCANKVGHFSCVYKFSSDNAPFLKKEEISSICSDINTDVARWGNVQTIDYSCCTITSLAGVSFPDTVTSLNLGSGHFLSSLAGFKVPPKLQYLNVSSNSLASLDYQSFPPTLERLDIHENKFYFLDGIDSAVSLKDLDASANRIDSLKYVTFPRNLKTLSLSYNPIECIKGARFPESLEHLDLSGLPNESMTGIKFPDGLQELNLQSSMTSTRGLKLPPNIKELNLASCGVNSINPLKLPNSIERLYLSDNNIKTLNKVTFPTAIRELWLGDNMISTLKNVQFPESLEVLDMSHDPDEEADKALTTLKDVYFPAGLKSLRLSWHQIKSVEAVEFPYALEELVLEGNELRVFRHVKFGPHIKMVDLSSNDELTSLDNVVFPESLRVLKLSPALQENLPATLVERANRGELKLFKSHVHI